MSEPRPPGPAERRSGRRGLSRWMGNRPEPEFSCRLGGKAVLLFLGLAAAFPALVDLGAYLLGQSTFLGGSVTSRPALLDGAWHAGIGLLLVLPARDIRLALFGPVLATEIDLDHVYGAYLPTEVGRPAHNLFFLLLLTYAAGVVIGRSGVWLVAAGWLGHLSVDGGGFPLLAPFARTSWPLPYALEVAMGAGAALLFFGARHPWSELRKPQAGLSVVAVALGIALLMALGGPALVQVSGV